MHPEELFLDCRGRTHYTISFIIYCANKTPCQSKLPFPGDSKEILDRHSSVTWELLHEGWMKLHLSTSKRRFYYSADLCPSFAVDSSMFPHRGVPPRRKGKRKNTRAFSASLFDIFYTYGACSIMTPNKQWHYSRESGNCTYPEKSKSAENPRLG